MSLKHLGDLEQRSDLPRILYYIVLCLLLQVHHNSRDRHLTVFSTAFRSLRVVRSGPTDIAAYRHTVASLPWLRQR